MKYLYKWLLLPIICTSVSYSQGVETKEVVINEILFNPSKDGYDYIEGYNRGSKTIHLDQLLIATRNVTNDISAAKPLSKTPLLLEPHSYFVVTANEKWLKQYYTVSLTANICQVASLPGFPDDEGTVVFLRKEDSMVIDELSYSEKWHFPLITDVSGVALERINYESPGQDKNNWTSASSSSGYGTPGFQNSQFRTDLQANGEVIVSPGIITPDNDGMDDFTFIRINMQPGYVANAMVYDISGRRVRHVIKNEILGAGNQFKWDGYDDSMQKLSAGIYIICTDIFNLNGRTKKFRNCIVIGP